MAQIRQVVSESLQATIRRLLPSQQGFTEDLQASNVIQPIIDLTPSAEGSALQANLAQALAFGSQTDFASNNATTNLANTAGFWRFVGTINVFPNNGFQNSAVLRIDDNGLAQKNVWSAFTATYSGSDNAFVSFDLILFLRTGDTAQFVTSADTFASGSYRQVADVSGNVVNPSGFTVS